MLFKECFKIHIIEYRANQGNVFPKKSSYCKDHAIQGFVNQGPTVYSLPNWHLYFIIIRHFLYYYLNGSYRGNSWTSGLPIRQSFFAVNSGL